MFEPMDYVICPVRGDECSRSYCLQVECSMTADSLRRAQAEAATVEFLHTGQWPRGREA